MLQDKGAILFLTSWYPVDSNPTHGIFIRNHALALSQFQKVIVVYAYSSDWGKKGVIEETIINDNLTEYRLCYTKPWLSVKPLSSFLQFVKYKKAHKQLIAHLQAKQKAIKAIQVNVVFPVALVLNLYRQAFTAKYTVLEHWSGYLKQDGNYKGGILKRSTQVAIAGAKKIWHVSEPQKQAMLAYGLKGNYELIYNVVNTSVFKPAEKKSARLRLLHVSSLVEREKNISGTFQVVKALQDKGYDFDFVVIGGEGDELKVVRDLAGQLQLRNTEFTGVLKPELVAEHMQQSSALVLFSHFEGMPVVALEALACGLPVFASKVGQLPFMITNEFGELVEPSANQDLIQALEKLLKGESKFNPNAMHNFVVKNASLNAVGAQMNNFYQ